MCAVGTLLDERNFARVERLKGGLARECGLTKDQLASLPHFSYQVADHYDLERVEPVLSRCAGATTVFTIRTSGVGIFSGESFVIFALVVRSPELSRLHQRIWAEMEPLDIAPSIYYRPDRWVPHITLAHLGGEMDEVARTVRFLSRSEFEWEVTADNLAVICDTNGQQEVRARFPLRPE